MANGRLIAESFTEVELQAIFESATPFELVLTGTLSNSRPRPGEIYALDWSAVYLDVNKPLALRSIQRTPAGDPGYRC